MKSHVTLDARPVDQEIDDRALNAYKSLRTFTLNRFRELDIRSTMVTGMRSGVGKTTTAINLAISLARHEHYCVMLVDLDLHAPAIAEKLGVTVSHGIEDFARGRCAWPECVMRHKKSRLYLLSAREPQNDSTEVLMAPRMTKLYQAIVEPSKPILVIYDTPAIVNGDEVSSLAPMMQSHLLVMEEGTSTRRELSESCAALSPLPLLGVALNKSRSRRFLRHPRGNGGDASVALYSLPPESVQDRLAR